MPEKVVLAYSGGLDTSIIIPWLKENYDYDVIAFVADVGQGDDLDAVVEKAYKTGACKVIVEDLRQEFLTDYVFPAIQAGAVYEHKYLLGTSLAGAIGLTIIAFVVWLIGVWLLMTYMGFVLMPATSGQAI